MIYFISWLFMPHFGFTHQALDVVKQTKIAEVLGSDYAKENNKDFRRRSNSRERIRRDSSDNVTYDRNFGDGDEVSIGVEWSGLAALVSISKAQKRESFQPTVQSCMIKGLLFQTVQMQDQIWSQGRWQKEPNAGLLFACLCDYQFIVHVLPVLFSSFRYSFFLSH